MHTSVLGGWAGASYPVAKAKAPPHIPRRRNLQRQLSPRFLLPFLFWDLIPHLWLEVLKILPNLSPKRKPAQPTDFRILRSWMEGVLCVSFKGGWEKRQTDISGGTNQLLRVRRTPSLDAGQRSSAFSLRPQHHPWRLPRDRARQHVLKWMCRAFGHCAKSLQMKGTDIVGAKGVAWGGEHTGSLPGPRCLNS